MSDSKDRHLADLFEIELRRKADLDPGNYWELVWFLQLPLETRCSYMRILEAQIDQDTTRKYLSRQSCYYQRNWRAPTRSCLAVEEIQAPTKPWQSIGHRQRRKVARSRPPKTCREHLSPQPTRVKSSPNHPTFKPAVKANQYTVPARPTTPNELRDALSAIATLACDAVGYAPVTLNQFRSPKVPNTPPEPESGPEPVTEQVPEEAAQCEPFPEPYPENGSLWVKDTLMQEDLAYFVAVGHYLRAPEDGYTIQDAAGDLYVLEYVAHEFYSSLFHAFSVEGNGESKRISLLPPLATTVIDLVRGWSVVPKSWKESTKLLPNPRPRCVHCSCIC
ncbi:unnamed protein product [Rhizoctonia solani]|uniref:Uncharacterized protein n=1 Tax=Rhizoctonia solani TaxID=456999 RepID=A0A8H3AHZ6_9AGAM|nr:unnamed protein product [Rhizoctonia solani]